MRPRLLVTGASGQVGRELARLAAARDLESAAMNHTALDICDATAVRNAVQAYAPTLILNAAAYTAVDKAESEPGKAYAVNRDGARNVAVAAASLGVPLVHFSTDYVFDGTKDEPWGEDDNRNPIGVYGASKAAGEDAVREVLDAHVIIRTAWVYSAHGHNFVRTMLKVGAERDELRIVDDQFGNPTSARDIAAAALDVAEALDTGKGIFGTFHYAGAGTTTWFRFAEAIFELATPLLETPPMLRPIPSTEYPTAAQRPQNSALDCHLIKKSYGIESHPWQDSLSEVMTEIAADRGNKRDT